MKFTIRDLFWLVLVVGMGCGWWLERRAKEQQEAAVRKYILELGAEMARMNDELVSLRGVEPLGP
jgi:hypothetical protein